MPQRRNKSPYRRVNNRQSWKYLASTVSVYQPLAEARTAAERREGRRSGYVWYALPQLGKVARASCNLDRDKEEIARRYQTRPDLK